MALTATHVAVRLAAGGDEEQRVWAEKSRSGMARWERAVSLLGAKRDELVRRAAEKFKMGLRNRQGEFGSVAKDPMAKSKNKRATAAEIIFSGGGNDDDSSDDDRG